jgi:hypothetical protein
MGAPAQWIHYFDEQIAVEYGLPQAVMIAHLRQWIRHNQANGTNLHDGRTWTYNSLEAWAELLPFWSADQVKRILNNLQERGVILKGNYNAAGYDRTCWYAFREEARWLGEAPPIRRNRQMDQAKTPNGAGGNAEPIPSTPPAPPPPGQPASAGAEAEPSIAEYAGGPGGQADPFTQEVPIGRLSASLQMLYHVQRSLKGRGLNTEEVQVLRKVLARHYASRVAGEMRKARDKVSPALYAAAVLEHQPGKQLKPKPKDEEFGAMPDSLDLEGVAHGR